MPKEDTQFKPGQSGNPGGRPKGFSITAMVRAELDKVEPKTKKKWGELIIKRILLKATNEGDVQMLKSIWSYMDGMPKQTTDIHVKEMPSPMLGGTTNAVSDNNSNKKAS